MNLQQIGFKFQHTVDDMVDFFQFNAVTLFFIFLFIVIFLSIIDVLN
jgi:hypothetical protein